MCGRCPRTTCVPCSGIKKNVADKLKGVLCAQHNCFDCQRATTAAGGMLYRCRTCEKAFCEDCLGEREQDARVSSGDVTKEVDYIGYTLPEMDDLDYGEQSTHFWIRCFDCINQGKCFVYTPPDPAVKEAAAAAAAAAAVLPKTKKSRSGEPLEKKQAVAPRPAPKAREAVPKDVLKKSRKPRTPKVVAPPQASDSNAAVVGDVADGFVAVGAPVDLLAATEPAMAFSYVSGSGDVIHHQQQQEQQDLESSSLSAVGSTSSLSLVEDAQQVFVDDSFAVSSDDLSSVSINSTES